MKVNLAKYRGLFVWVATFMLISRLIGYITRANGMSEWQQLLSRSALTPPSFVFPIVWGILYVMLAIAGWLIWKVRPINGSVNRAKLFFALQMLLNWAWTPLFFWLHWVGASSIVILFIVIFTALLFYNIHRISKAVVCLMLPYLVWSLFALYLNSYIYFNN